MHLPYAYQGRRMLTEIYALYASNATITCTEDATEYQKKLKEISKSGTYKTFVTEKSMSAEIASPLIRNLYTGSVFMGLLSTLSHFYDTQKEIAGSTFGF